MKRLLSLVLLAAPVHADELDDRATKVFSQAFSTACTAAFNEDGSLIEPPQRFDVQAASTYGEPTPMVVWQYRCNIGAYNVQSVFLGQSEMNGILPLMVARPDLDVVLEDPENFEGPVKEVKIVGWSASPFVVNGTFDPATGDLSAQGLWRGIGDASDTGLWRLVDEGFRLMRFDVDATYDGQINPITLFDVP